MFSNKFFPSHSSAQETPRVVDGAYAGSTLVDQEPVRRVPAARSGRELVLGSLERRAEMLRPPINVARGLFARDRNLAERNENLRLRLRPEGILDGERQECRFPASRSKRADPALEPKRPLPRIHKASLRRQPNDIFLPRKNRCRGAQELQGAASRALLNPVDANEAEKSILPKGFRVDGGK